MRRLMVAAALLGLLAGVAQGAPGDGCKTVECKVEVRRQVRDGWREEARPYRDWIASTIECESGSDGKYELTTTGNGFWFAAQFTPSTWRSVGGRLANGDPRGTWTKHPDRAEQDARMVRVLKAQGRGAWPTCGGG